MKITLRIAIIFLYAALAFTACQENSTGTLGLSGKTEDHELSKEEAEILREQLLCRNWLFSEIVQSNGMDEQRLEVFRPILDATFSKAEFEFNQGGSFKFTLAGEVEEGTWHLNREGDKILTIEKETEEEHIITLVEVAQDKLVLTFGDDEVTLLLVPHAKP